MGAHRQARRRRPHPADLRRHRHLEGLSSGVHVAVAGSGEPLKSRRLGRMVLRRHEMQTFAKVLAVCFLAGAASLPLVAQTSGGCQSVTPPLPKTDTCIRIDTADPLTQALRQPNVVSGDRVYIELVRKPVEKCSIQLKTDIIQPPPSGITTFLKTVKIASAQTPQDVCQLAADGDVDRPNSAKSTAVTNFEMEGKLLHLIVVNLNQQIDVERTSYSDVAKKLTGFQNCKNLAKMDICKDESIFETTQEDLIVSIDKVLSDPIPTATLADYQLKKVQDTFTKIPDTD